MSLLHIADLEVRYGAVLGAQSVSLDVPEGQAVALLGANGAGKTTTLRAIGGLLRYSRGRRTRGTIQLAGRSITSLAPEALVRAGIGQALEGRRIFADISVSENLAIGAFAVPRRQRLPQQIHDVLSLFPRLGERMAQQAGTLSGGEQQMLAIGRALMAQPRLLLLDEPSLGLAPRVIEEIASAIKKIVATGTSVLLVDQNTELAMAATHTAYLVENGRTTRSGPTSQLLHDPLVRAAYLGADVEPDDARNSVRSHRVFATGCDA